ncbi:histidine kinase [Alkalihalobacillus alcalophilus ATCC 27647 = CGMCC 1.3604]|uniref:Histidine kinase n=1 Tax=Alkalihalobacillus alcalophilus ATCC 27647 = CGMCC 1.3604 TaxID=1218173 RepID=A0A094WJ09_ALKAL|nr:hypothetical protein [Alkalihalobacillus alcalophilus]KGA95943.1 histidine kinase [Alkalihalobacillus alcalophilus ATCC 27647 = CGMCC 1.3604]MED1561761.1 histidine kinase [Alkalihalobacillus alcalophilus]THG89085.1 histidine kinase [Alkalihalobacillus alcalophilus ATCC 27647 = CGMCC 1.3604]
MDKLKWFLYFSAVLLVGIPISIALMSDTTFSSTFSQIVISTATFLVILGKFITVFQKRKENKRFAGDIGAIIGLFIVIIFTL